MKALKIAGIALLAFVLLASAVVGIVVLRFDAARIKAEIARVAMERTQRRLAIDGELQLSFWPRLGVRIGKLSLSERGSERTFATLEAARVSVEVKPLFSHRIVVDEIAAEGLHAAIVRHKDGTLNIDDLLAPDDSASQPMQIDLAGIRIADMQLTWHDEKTGSQATLTDLDLATGRVHADSGAGTLQAAAVALSAKGKLAAGAVALRLAAPELALAPGKAIAADIALDATFDDGKRNKFTGRLALAGTEATAQTLRIAKLGLNLDAQAGDADVKAILDTSLAADIGRQRLALEKFSGSLDFGHPLLPMKRLRLPIDGSLTADLAKPSAAGRLATRLDGSKAALKFDVARLAPPAFGFDLDIDRLDLDKYLPANKSGSGAQAGGTTKFDLAAYKDIEADGRIRIGSLQVAGVTASNLVLQVKAAGGRVDVANRQDGKVRKP